MCIVSMQFHIFLCVCHTHMHDYKHGLVPTLVNNRRAVLNAGKQEWCLTKWLEA